MIFFVNFVFFVSSQCTDLGVGYAAEDPRAIVAEAQRRTDSMSQRYEGSLQVFDAKGKISDKRWTYDRLGAQARGRCALVAPPE
jgi:hypothetical protein